MTTRRRTRDLAATLRAAKAAGARRVTVMDGDTKMVFDLADDAPEDGGEEFSFDHESGDDDTSA